MKKRIVVLLTILLVNVFLFAACGNTSLNQIKQKFKDEGYSVTTMPQADIDKIAGVSEGFYARLGKEWNEETSGEPISDVKVWVYKFNNKDLAEEFAGNTSEINAVSLKNVYVCRVQHYIIPDDGASSYFSTDSAETNVALDIFNSFF